MESQLKNDILKNRLFDIWDRRDPPDPNDFLQLVERINQDLINEDENIRPHDALDLPGGIISLKQNIPTILVPDIHARMDLILSIMLFEDADGHTVIQNMAMDKVQVVCVGDGVHAEKRAAQRWANAFKEFETDYAVHKNIDEEMRESFGVMEMIMEIKSCFPLNFHFLKGNHENISNEEGDGNHPFMKFSYEGPMVAYYVEKFYGEEFLEKYSNFEKNLPIFAIGKNFLVSHAEPRTFYDRETLIEYRDHPEAIIGLTWTSDDAAEDDSVGHMIDYYIDNINQDAAYYFGGHRPVKGLYNERANGRYIQIHNPDKFIIAVIDPNKQINLEEDIIEIDNCVEKINGPYLEGY